MENSVRDSEELVIPKKPRSLDLQSLYVEKEKVSNEGDEATSLKRKRRSSGDEELGSGQAKKKKKSLKEVSLCSLDSVNKNSRSSSNSVDGLKLSEFLVDRKDLVKKINDQLSDEGNLQKVGGITDISTNLGDNAVPIPKKPRCFSRKRRKTFQNNSMTKENGISYKVSSDDRMVKLADPSVTPIPSSEGKQKKVLDEFKKNSSSRTSSARSFKSRDGASVRYRDLISRSVRRNRGKRRELKQQEHTHGHRDEPTVGNSVKPQKDLEEHDDLEKNAAWMLSARFDPSCTVFSGNGNASASQSANMFSFGSSVRGGFGGSRENCSSGLKSDTVDAAGRILRPRKQGKEKRKTRKRRHFYEILYGDVDAYWVVNQRIKVFWPLDESWYFGLVIGYDPEKNLHHVKYDDREEEWIDLQNERFKLLLLPSEVPCKSASGQSGLGGKLMVEKNGNMNVDDDNCSGSFMDSEPIISWLARSTRRVKSSPLGIVKKQKTHSLSKSDLPMLLEDSVGTSHGCLADGPRRPDTNKLSNDLELKDRSDDGEMAKKSMMESASCSNVRATRFVYFRKRFRQRDPGLGCISRSSECGSIVVSNSLHPSVTDGVGGAKACSIACQFSGLEDMAPGCVLWSGENLGLLRLTVAPLKSKEVNLKLNVALRSPYLAHGAGNTLVYRALLLLQYGTVMVMWPKVQLQMLFVDNVAGLRFLLFEGCLMKAVAFVCMVLVAFNQPNECMELGDPQLPVTSIRFDLSGFENLGRRLVFTFYNFLEVKNSKWLHLDGKLKPYCSVTKQLPLAECTYDNVQILQSRSSQLPVPSVSEEPVSLEVPRRRSRQGSMRGIYKESGTSMALSSSTFIEKPKKLPPFVLPFSAAPTFFLSLHLKLLMAKNVASINFRNPVSLLEAPENSCKMIADDHPLVEEASAQMAVDNDTGYASSHDATGPGLVSCAESKVVVEALPIRNDGDWTKSSQKCLNSELVVAETSVGLQGSVSRPSIPKDQSSQAKPELNRFSHLNGIQVQIPEVNEVERQSYDVGSQSARLPRSDLVWNVKAGAIRSPNPTAPRSIWHRNRHNSGSLSFGYRSRIWPDGNEDLSHNGVVNGSRKPRSQVSYLLPFGSNDFSSRPRSHHRNRRHYKRIRTDSGKMVAGDSTSPQRHLELLSCDGNLLITEGDRGWREYGVHVVLECVDRNDWRLLVKRSGVTKYSYKAYQFLQPGATNRYTHAMMWKGGKDWILEFPDRSQWTLFKEMHEECYNRNIRAASVKSIPIPGVRLIEENDDNAVEVPFFRSSPKYFRQVETEVEMALNPSCVLYDMESDDEDWISNHQTSSEACADNSLDVSEEMFERTMDMFEKVAYAQQRDNFTSDEIEELMVGLGPIHVVKDIYEYWQQKRQRKGMPLIRQFQPPLWERYQQQLKDWESAVNKFHNLPSGCKEKGTMMQKPPMYAFCLRPRGLEVPNRGSKQRSHRKLSAGGHNYSFSRDPDGFGRRSNGFACGEDRFASGPNHDSLYGSSWHSSTRVLSPRDAVSSGYLSMSSDGSERNQQRKLHRSKSKKMKTFISSNDSQMTPTSYNQRLTNKRNGASRWNVGLPEWPSQKHHHPEGFQRHGVEKLGGPDLDEFRLRDASGAAQHASNMAKLKREKAQRLLYRADLAIHKAMVALMTAEAIKASSEDRTDDR